MRGTRDGQRKADCKLFVAMNYKILQGDSLEVLKTLEPESINCCITSPPYWGLRDYGHDKQLGLEPTPEQYVENMVAVFRKVWQVLKEDGVMWLNLGDSYNGSGGAGGDYSTGGLKEGHPKYPGRNITTLKPKDLVGIPWRVAFALQADGWYLRQDIIWHKPNPMPESVKDRCTKAHEYIFLMSKSANYHFDSEAIKEKATGLDPGNKNPTRANGTYHREGTLSSNSHKIEAKEYRNKRSVWSVTVKPYSEAHFATFPKELIEPCVLAGCPKGGTILDPFGGSGTTAEVALENRRNAILIELNPEYIKLAEKRISGVQPKLFV